MDNDIRFIKGEGGLARPLPGKDHYSGIAYYAEEGTTAPAGWNYGEPQQVFSLPDMAAKGINAETSGFAVLHYHVKAFFSINPGASLWIVLQDMPESGQPDYAEIDDLMNEKADIRQIGVYIPMAFASTMVGSLQAKAESMEAAHKPIQIVLQPTWHTISIGVLDDLRLLTSPKVAVCIAQDSTDEVIELMGSDTSPGALGTALGIISLAAVNECIGWVGRFDITGANGAWDIPALGDGTLIKTLTDTEIDTLNAKGYLVVTKRIGLSGSWFYDSPTCIVATSDYAYIENNRTIDKAIRGMYAYMLPEVNSPARVSGDGKLAPDYVKYMESVASKALVQMERNGELSAFYISINPDQDVLSTSKLEVTVVLVPVGVNRKIEITIGFGLSI